MHAFLSAEDSEKFLLAELRQDRPGNYDLRSPGLITGATPSPPASDARGAGARPAAEGPLVFCRQFLPEARQCQASSIREWSERLIEAVATKLPEDQPWLLHVAPHYGSEDAGKNRCCFIREAVLESLQHRRRRWRRQLIADAAPLTPAHSVVQLLLLDPDNGLLSVASAPVPFQLRRSLSPFPKGELPVAVDKAAPSRAFAKLVETELRLGRSIAAGETCVDLGASPGSWSYVALNRGAQVIAVDRAPLREDLMRHPRLEFQQGDAFQFVPRQPVDWLLCDVIAAPERSIELLLDWIRNRRARRFVVTIKFKGRDEYAKLDLLKRELPGFCAEFFLSRLSANKNEACAFGEVGLEPAARG